MGIGRRCSTWNIFRHRELIERAKSPVSRATNPDREAHSGQILRKTSPASVVNVTNVPRGTFRLFNAWLPSKALRSSDTPAALRRVSRGGRMANPTVAKRPDQNVPRGVFVGDWAGLESRRAESKEPTSQKGERRAKCSTWNISRGLASVDCLALPGSPWRSGPGSHWFWWNRERQKGEMFHVEHFWVGQLGVRDHDWNCSKPLGLVNRSDLQAVRENCPGEALWARAPAGKWTVQVAGKGFGCDRAVGPQIKGWRTERTGAEQQVSACFCG
jgi:hypothetical protein